MNSLVKYDIWKITGWGRKQIRYYESEKMFNKYWNLAQRAAEDYKFYRIKAFQFTSDGWQEMGSK